MRTGARTLRRAATRKARRRQVEEEEDESDDEFCDRTTAPVPKWEVLAGNRAVWVQLCQQLQLDQGSLG